MTSSQNRLPSTTVAICTYNRCASLDRTLSSIANASVPRGLEWELLVVDNNSTDSTAATIERFGDRLPLRRICERQQGLSHARNRAVAESAGELLIFTDDDVVVDPAWLATIVNAAAGFPELDFFGGRVLPMWPDGCPKWFREETLAALGGLLVSHDLGHDSRAYCSMDMPPVGANMAFRKSVLMQSGLFRVDLGVKGTRRLAGEDSDMIYRMQAAGSQGRYLGAALCHHCVEKHRTTLRHAFDFGVCRGVSEVALQGPAAPDGQLWRAVLCLARGCLQLIKRRGDRARLCLRNAGIEIGLRAARHGGIQE